MPDFQSILEEKCNKALQEFNNDEGKSFFDSLSTNGKKWLTTIAKYSESQKAVVSVLVTSLTKKIETPSKDVRYHQDQLEGGYSGRTLDTQYVTPFMKKHFRRIAMKEAGWLTRSLEQPYPYTLDYQGKIRNKEVRNAFLQILNDVEVNNADPEKYLIGLFILLIRQRSSIQTLISKKPLVPTEASIDLIVSHLQSHFFGKYTSHGASKLPVIAIYSLYQIMVKELDRYKNKKLKALKSHLAADVRAGEIGDIEVVDEKNRFFEGVEIKLGKPITADMVNDSYEKFKAIQVNRYYLLTTADPFVEEKEKEDLKKVIDKIRKQHGCEVIVNGVIKSIKYYLRLIGNPEDFIKAYTENLKYDVSTGTEIKEEHLRAWLNLFPEKEQKIA
jgi:DNA (cytosine-5)-methyltransferase 1